MDIDFHIGEKVIVHRYGKGTVVAREHRMLPGSSRYGIELENNPFPYPVVYVWPQEIQVQAPVLDMPDHEIHLSGQGWASEKVAELLLDQRARLEPFNRDYLMIALTRPSLPPAKSGINRFIQEGGPEYNAPTLVPIEIVRQAIRLIDDILYLHTDDEERRHDPRFFTISDPDNYPDIIVRPHRGENAHVVPKAEFDAQYRKATTAELMEYYGLPPSLRPLYRLRNVVDPRYFMDVTPAGSPEKQIAPQGGGMVLTLSPEQFEQEFRTATIAEQAHYHAKHYSQVRFENGPSYRCLLSEKRWNGWAMPSFPRDAAMAVLKDLSVDDPTESVIAVRIHRDEKRLTLADAGNELIAGDTIVIWYPGSGLPEEEAEHYAPSLVNGEELWDIGAGSWCWDEVTPTTQPDDHDTPTP